MISGLYAGRKGKIVRKVEQPPNRERAWVVDLKGHGEVTLAAGELQFRDRIRKIGGFYF